MFRNPFLFVCTIKFNIYIFIDKRDEHDGMNYINVEQKKKNLIKQISFQLPSQFSYL